MSVPWLGLIDLLLGVIDLRRSRKAAAPGRAVRTGGRKLKHLEARIAGVMVEALNEGRERDRQRWEAAFARREQARREAERQRALALLREAGDREIGRLRLVAGLALAGWAGSLFVVAMLAGAAAGPRVIVAAGWVVLLAAMSSALAAQTRLARALARLDDPNRRPPDSGIAGIASTGLLVFGLLLVAIAALTI
jgi:hypothetical protein